MSDGREEEGAGGHTMMDTKVVPARPPENPRTSANAMGNAKKKR